MNSFAITKNTLCHLKTLCKFICNNKKIGKKQNNCDNENDSCL